MSKLKVLMLGWEFPPLINGGLGVACYGLANALSKYVDLHVILPKVDENAKYDDYRVSALGKSSCYTESKTTFPTSQKLESFASLSYVNNPGISPYYNDADTETHETRNYRTTYGSHSHTEEASCKVPPPFTIDKLYGEDVEQKVHEFSDALKVEALKYEFDVIHAHDWMTYLAGVELKKASGKPLVVHLHASQYDRAGPDAKGWIYEIERLGLHEADLVIPVSNYTGYIVRDHYGVPEHKIKTVHNGAESVKTFRSKKKFPEKVVLFLGRLTAQKGPEFFLEIASLVMAENQNVRFVMAGTGEKIKQLIEAGAFKGLGGRFHFTGFLDKEKVNKLLSMTDIYCMPSVSEPFGLSALEAAQFNIPAVISKQSGVAEILKGALKADFWDTELMAQHINNLLNDEELYAKVIKDGQKDLAASTWRAASERIVQLYDSIV